MLSKRVELGKAGHGGDAAQASPCPWVILPWGGGHASRPGWRWGGKGQEKKQRWLGSSDLRRQGHGGFAKQGALEGRGALMEDEVYESPPASPISLCYAKTPRFLFHYLRSGSRLISMTNSRPRAQRIYLIKLMLFFFFFRRKKGREGGRKRKGGREERWKEEKKEDEMEGEGRME